MDKHRCAPQVLVGGRGGGFPSEAGEAGTLTGTSQLTGTSECNYSVGGEE